MPCAAGDAENLCRAASDARRARVRGQHSTRAPPPRILDSVGFDRWKLLRAVDTATLARRLKDHGISVTRRTIQRDLERLSSRLPLHCNDASKPYAWAWHEGGGESFRALVLRVAKHVER